mmetsp:Transcript_58100/g.92323  ORF Transcript_58100/g.92323 Transcript_58100/m.92323 type:complete len:275 (-) Transcript_58100:109-933(-)
MHEHYIRPAVAELGGEPRLQHLLVAVLNDAISGHVARVLCCDSRLRDSSCSAFATSSLGTAVRQEVLPDNSLCVRSSLSYVLLVCAACRLRLHLERQWRGAYWRRVLDHLCFASFHACFECCLPRGSNGGSWNAPSSCLGTSEHFCLLVVWASASLVPLRRLGRYWERIPYDSFIPRGVHARCVALRANCIDFPCLQLSYPSRRFLLGHRFASHPCRSLGNGCTDGYLYVLGSCVDNHKPTFILVVFCDRLWMRLGCGSDLCRPGHRRSCCQGR